MPREPAERKGFSSRCGTHRPAAGRPAEVLEGAEAGVSCRKFLSLLHLGDPGGRPRGLA
jgi:hypothetical protein